MTENPIRKRLLVVGVRGTHAQIARRSELAGAQGVNAARSGTEVQIDITHERTIVQAAESFFSGSWDRLPDERRCAFSDGAAAGSLAGRVGTLGDVTDTALWLLAAAWVTGETIHVDGGTRHR